MSRGLSFLGSRGRTEKWKSTFPGRRSGRGMIVALVKNKYRGKI
jgi:hypothetical protein